MATVLLNKEISDWDNKFNAAAAARKPFEEQWYMNLAFYFGRQYAQWDRSITGNRLVEPPAPRNRVRLVINKVRPIVRREITKLTKEEPQFYAIPATTEAEDVNAAKIAENLMGFLLYRGNYNGARRKAAFWTSTTGTGFLKVGCPGRDKDISYDAPPPFQIYIPLIQEEETEKQPWICHARAVSPEELYTSYGVDIKPDSLMDSGTLEQRFFNALGIKTNNNESNKNMCFVKEFWVKPCRQYPEGGLIVIADNKIIYRYSSQTPDPATEQMNPLEAAITETTPHSEMPYEHGMYPILKMPHIPTGRYFGESVITDIIPLQKEYNRSRSQMVESKNRTAKPQMVYQKGSIDATKVTSEPGLMIPVQPGFEAPKYLTAPEWPSYAIQLEDRNTQDINDLSSQNEITRGGTPPGVEAASAIAYLQEENDSILHLTIAGIELATQIAGKQSLSLMKQYWSPDKMIKIVSENDAIETMEFTMSDLEGDTDVRVEAGSMAPRSRAAKQAFITELMKMGIIPPEKGLQYLQMNETNRMYAELQTDSKAARRENFYMAKKQQPVQINIWDNHEVHLYEHGLFMKSQEFELLPPEIRMMFEQHYVETKAAIQGEALQNAQLPAPGAGADPSGQPVGIP